MESETPDPDGIEEKFLSFLNDFPNYKPENLTLLSSHPKTRKIIKSMSKGHLEEINVEDFQDISEKEEYPLLCATALLNYGMRNSNESILNLAAKLLEGCRKYLNPSKENYGKSLIREGLAKETIAKMGIEVVKNLQEDLKLQKDSRIVFDEKSPYYGDSLIYESSARQILAENGIKPLKNLEIAIELLEESRDIFEKESVDYTRTLPIESQSRLKLANMGINPTENLRAAVKIIRESKECFGPENMYFCAASSMDEGVARKNLAESGFEPIENLEMAIELFDESKKIFPKDSQEYASVVMDEANARLHLAELGVDGLRNFQESIKLYQEVKELNKERIIDYAWVLINEGVARTKFAQMGLETSLKNMETAVKLFDEAKTILVEENQDYAWLLLSEGSAREHLAKQGEKSHYNLDKAAQLYNKAGEIYSRAGNIREQIRVNSNLGSLYYDLDKMEESYNYLKKAIDSIENIRSSVKVPEHRKNYFETLTSSYNVMVFTCLSLGKKEEAFKYVESVKGRVFLEYLVSEKKEVKGDPQLVSEYHETLKEITEIESMIFEEKRADEQSKLIDELEKLETKHDHILMEIKETDPLYYSLKKVEPVNINEIKGILNGKTLLEYFSGKKLAIFVLNDDLMVKEVDIDFKDLNGKIVKFQDAIEDISGSESSKRLEIAEDIARELYKLLIEPVKEYLHNEIVIVPHGYLHFVPFQALKGDDYLIEEYKISFGPSAWSLKFLKEGNGEGALVVGNTTGNLEGAEKEAKSIAPILKTTPLIREEAKKSIIMENMMDKKILHFACHGWFDATNPAFSRLILADGMLEARDFMNMDIKASLTVLSACESALSGLASGDELEGLVRAIHTSGSRYVIASLWSVNDTSTMELFLNFYKNKGEVMDKMRNAEMDLIKKGYNMYLWAPFQVYGV